eukprot:3071716-Amphidinium_carterae.1
MRNASSAGPDSWRPAELKCLPQAALVSLAEVFNAVERTGHWPPGLATSWTSLLAKSPRIASAAK